MRVLFPFTHLEEENLGVMYLAATLKRGGHQAEVVQATERAVSRRLADGAPTILAFSTIAFYARHLLRLNRRLRRRHQVFSLFGGHHPTAAPELVRQPGVDALCLGEGEAPLLELANLLEDGRDVTAVRNLWVRAPDGELVKNPLRPLAQDLDVLPFPDRGLFPRRAPFFQERIGVLTSRGCTHACPYCYNSTLRRLYGGESSTYRRRSVENVITEIVQARRRLPVRFVLFHDDIFTVDAEWVRRFSREYRQRVGIPFNCNVRIDQVTDEVAGLLAEAGCHSVSFGLESGDARVRSHTLGRPMDEERMVHQARRLKALGLRLRTTNMVGARPGSLEADLASVRLNIRCGVDFAKVGALAAYPGTDLGRETERHGATPRWGELEEVSPPLLVRLLGRLSSNQLGRYQRKENMFFAGGDGDNPDAARLDRLQKLFPLLVEWPALLRLIGLLLRLPPGLDRALVLANFLWDNHCSYFRIYHAGYLSLPRGLWAYHRRRGGSA